MDILRKELNAIYAGQRLADEALDAGLLEATLKAVERFAAITQGCCVVTDASADTCHLFGGRFARLLGITEADTLREKVDSSDEDAIYARLHPEDLVEKRMLEYEFFKYVDPLPAEEKTQYKAACTIRIRNRADDYLSVKNTTQVLVPSRPNGRIWLILCTYDLSPGPARAGDIEPRIVCNATGLTLAVRTQERRAHILTPREKEILRLIREGKPSKQIADRLNISIHTVSRHRQNILEKLSVGNSVEAVMAAVAMGLLPDGGTADTDGTVS